MTELRDNPALQPARPAAGGEAASGEGAPDPLHNLYRMSRTAGLGSGEYVAINNVSVVAFLMGLASVLALLNPFLLVFVVAAVILGVMALIQIRSSNGTQTGQGFAVVAILLALVFGGATGGKMAMARAEQRSNEEKIARVITVLGERLARGEYEQAYSTLFSEQFHKDFSKEQFVSRWEDIIQNTGPVQSAAWGGRAEFEPPRVTGGRRARARAFVKFEKFEEPSPLTFALAEQEGEWVIESIGELFNADADRRQQQQRNPAQSPMMGPQLPTGP